MKVGTSEQLRDEHANDGIDRRGFLKCMAGQCHIPHRGIYCVPSTETGRGVFSWTHEGPG
jgi:hypothetical protein